MKKFLMFLVMLSIIFSIMGCNSANNTTEQTTEKVTEKATELVVWAPTPDTEKMQVTWDRAFKDFEEQNPGTKVVFQTFPWAEVGTKLMAAHLSGKTPDVVQMNAENIAPAIDKGALVKIGAPDEEYFSEFVPSALEPVTYSNGIYGLPFKVNTRLLFYNKKMFASAGITKLPENWSEFVDATKKLTIDTNGDGTMDQYGVSFGLKQSQLLLVISPFVYGNGGSILNAENTKSALTQPEAIEAVQFISDLIYVHKVTPPGELERTKDDVRPLFISKKVAIFGDALSGANVIKEQGPDVDFGVMIFPGGKLRSGNVVAGWSLVIPSKSNNQEKALALIKWLIDPVNIDLVDSLPGKKDALALPLFSNDPLNSVAKEQLLYSRANPVVPQWLEIREIFTEFVQRALLNEKTPKEAMGEADKLINDILSK